MPLHSFHLPQPMEDAFKQVQAQTGLTFSELLRRMVDHGLQLGSLNAIVPYMSGQLGGVR